MKEIPILFSTLMVQALLAGRKFVTRRTRNLKKVNQHPDSYDLDMMFVSSDGNLYASFRKVVEGGAIFTEKVKCPYGKPGDLLWVRETFRKYCASNGDYIDYDDLIVDYYADGHDEVYLLDADGFQEYKADGTEKFVPWKPSIHMKKEHARIWLEVEEVRVERLHDISEDDAKAEGVEDVKHAGFLNDYSYWKNYHPEMFVNDFLLTPGASFMSLWHKINGPDGWDANPWVWVVRFKVLSTTGKPVSTIPRNEASEARDVQQSQNTLH